MTTKRAWFFTFILLFLIMIFFFYPRSKVNNYNPAKTPLEESNLNPLVVVEKKQESLLLGARVVPPVQEVKPTEISVPEKILKARVRAKFTLNHAYLSLKAFHAEVGRHSTDLYSLGFDPAEIQENGIVSFKIGFIKPFFPQEPFDHNDIIENPESMTSDTYMREPMNITNPDRDVASYSESANKISLDDYQKYCRMDCTADKDNFEMILVLPIEGHSNDVWIINEKKELKLACDGFLNDC